MLWDKHMVDIQPNGLCPRFIMDWSFVIHALELCRFSAPTLDCAEAPQTQYSFF